MVKHIVMWSFKEGVSLGQKMEMKARLEGLKGIVPSLRKIEVGLDQSNKPAAMDMVLYTEFDSFDDLEAYATHSAHQDVVGFVRGLVDGRSVVDYEN